MKHLNEDILRAALVGYEAESKRLEAAIADLQATLAGGANRTTRKPGKIANMPPEKKARPKRKLSAALKKRWAALNKRWAAVTPISSNKANRDATVDVWEAIADGSWPSARSKNATS